MKKKEIDFRMFSNNNVRKDYIRLRKWENTPEIQKRIELNDINAYGLMDKISSESFDSIIHIKDNDVRTEIIFYGEDKGFSYENTFIRIRLYSTSSLSI